MKLLYTAIGQDMTEILAGEAQGYAEEGKRVFYIAPNSLSFEKERKVLRFLPNKGSFAITITRFSQMARYFMLKERQTGKSLDDLGLAMVFYRVLSQMADDDLALYGHFRKDPQFVKQLVSLYHELQKSQLGIDDLIGLDTKKWSDLSRIFAGVTAYLADNHFEIQSSLTRFSKAISTGQVDKELVNTVLVIDGFTRFSAEEEHLLTLLNARCHQIVIGTYASQKAYKTQYRVGNLYEASVDFLRHLAEKFQTKPLEIPLSRDMTGFDLLTARVEATSDFQEDESEQPHTSYPVSIWESSNQKEELEALARDIRARLFEGYRYKDILVLLGNSDSYSLQLGQIFKRYGIPYYLGKAESMAHHPLVHFVESLERLKRYHFRAEDLIQLLKTGLYGNLSEEDIDAFETYLRFADLKGLSAFQRPFTYNKQDRFDLDRLNSLREMVMAPLEDFFKTKSQKMNSLLAKWTEFLDAINLTDNLSKLVNAGEALEIERHEEVWRAFTGLLETMQVVVEGDKMTLSDFLALLTVSMQTRDYRLVPATLDVVNVNSYELIEPHTRKLVYAIGLTQGNFPKAVSQLSLITDEERRVLNENLTQGRLERASQDNQKRHHFIFLSLLNAASDHLILSAPRLYQEAEEGLSPYLRLLEQLGLSIEVKGYRGTKIEDLGSYYGLLSRLVDFYQSDLEAEDFKEEEQTFWSVAIRVLRKKLAKDGLHLPSLAADVTTVPLSQDSLERLYPVEKGIQLSASALTEFYNNEYGYFLRYVLGLQEALSIHPDARQDGNFLHRVFERVLADQSEMPFDQKLDQALTKTKAESDYQSVYEQDAQSRYTQKRLESIVLATASLLRDQSVVDVLAEEASFGQGKSSPFLLSNGYKLTIRGKIDRLDKLKNSTAYGVVDYKSSDKTFHLGQFYNKLSPQLMTYLLALTQENQLKPDQIFGAMYLHMQSPSVKLRDTAGSEDVLANLTKELRYKGLFLDSQTNQLSQDYASSRSQFSEEDLEIMLAYTKKLYCDAAEKILSGDFAINPYTKDGLTVLGEQFKAITGFEANRHMAQARLLTAFPRAKQKETIMAAMKGELDK